MSKVVASDGHYLMVYDTNNRKKEISKAIHHEFIMNLIIN